MQPAAFVKLCIPAAMRQPPTGPAWMHKIKHDGFRLIVWRDGERVRLFTRRRFDWTQRYSWTRLKTKKPRQPGYATDGGRDVVKESLFYQQRRWLKEMEQLGPRAVRTLHRQGKPVTSQPPHPEPEFVEAWLGRHMKATLFRFGLALLVLALIAAWLWNWLRA